MLGAMEVCEARRVSKGIGEAIVDGLEACRIGIAEPGDLKWGGFAGKDEEAVTCGMACEVDEDVDSVFPDETRGLFIGKAYEAPPGIGMRAEPLSHGIRHRDLSIGEDIEGRAVKIFEQREEEASDDVFPEIWRDKADAQAAFWIAVVGMRLDQ